MRAAHILALVMLASLMLVQSHDAGHHISQAQQLPKIASAPEFALTSQDGAPVKLADFRGKVWP
jgi:cytochrome oxidase Cu insertion factor (SCO1/SenC/PrrC family)